METRTFEKLFKKRNPNHVFLLKRMQAALGKKEITFADITTSNLRTFKEYMEDEVTANSMRTYFAVLKATCTEMFYDGLIPNVKCLSVLNTKATPQQNIALTESDVHKLESYYDRLMLQSGHQVEKDVLTLFLLECLCGARGSDVEQMTEENIQEGRLTYVSKKTKVMAVMPAHRRLSDLLARKPTKQYSRTTKNRIVKEACRRCGFTESVTLFYHGHMVTKQRYELVGFHTARRSFASVLAAKGAPIIEIAQFMSHKNTQMTNRYIKVDTSRASAAALSFFND